MFSILSFFAVGIPHVEIPVPYISQENTPSESRYNTFDAIWLC